MRFNEKELLVLTFSKANCFIAFLCPAGTSSLHFKVKLLKENGLKYYYH